MVITQGDVFWCDLGEPEGSGPAGRRPVLVVQSDLFNRTRIATTVVVALTTTPRLADLPGNVRFQKDEANLPRTCAANVTQVATVDRSRLREKIGTVSREKLEAVRKGLFLVLWGQEQAG